MLAAGHLIAYLKLAFFVCWYSVLYRVRFSATLPLTTYLILLVAEIARDRSFEMGNNEILLNQAWRTGFCLENGNIVQ